MTLNTTTLYQRIIFIVNVFVKKAYGLEINELKGLNPTVEELAKDLNFLASVIEKISKDEYSDINMAINASQCAIFMERIANSVIKNNQTEVDKLMVKLEKIVKGGCYG